MEETKPQAEDSAGDDQPIWSPLYDKIIVKRDPKKVSVGRFAVPDAHQEEQNTGTVLAVGDGRWIDGALYPLTVHPGMTVLFSKFAGIPIDGDVPDLLVMREDELLAYKR